MRTVLAPVCKASGFLHTSAVVMSVYNIATGNAGYCFLHLSDLRLAFSSDEEQLSWLKAFERSGAVTGQTEEVRLNLDPGYGQVTGKLSLM